MSERTTILNFCDMGYQCRECVLDMLAPYVGDNANLTTAERVEHVIAERAPPVHLADHLRDWLGSDSDRAHALLHLVHSGPGTCKTTMLSLIAIVLGPRRVIDVTYNTMMAMALREMGAVNSHTYHSLGMRAMSKGILRHIRESATCVAIACLRFCPNSDTPSTQLTHAGS